jgi:hypothetical protein
MNNLEQPHATIHNNTSMLKCVDSSPQPQHSPNQPRIKRNWVLLVWCSIPDEGQSEHVPPTNNKRKTMKCKKLSPKSLFNRELASALSVAFLLFQLHSESLVLAQELTPNMVRVFVSTHPITKANTQFGKGIQHPHPNTKAHTILLSMESCNMCCRKAVKRLRENW